MWIGTNIGPLLLYKKDITSDTPIFTQVKVPRNDGTNYADYLLSGVDISCIAIDGSNRKWFGTNGNGIYVISNDCLTQIYHFTTNNSNLLSNNIEAIAINEQTGEVFAGTDKGLCSYMSDASSPNNEMTKDNVWAYPNPVKPDYTGLITITGLSFDADIKIVTTNGILVNQGRSNGGTYTWNGKDLKGQKVASGIYMVETATSDGSKGTVCKIAIVK
jgi:ligand-binding sensor domain-containing protein